MKPIFRDQPHRPGMIKVGYRPHSAKRDPEGPPVLVWLYGWPPGKEPPAPPPTAPLPAPPVELRPAPAQAALFDPPAPKELTR